MIFNFRENFIFKLFYGVWGDLLAFMAKSGEYRCKKHGMQGTQAFGLSAGHTGSWKMPLRQTVYDT